VGGLIGASAVRTIDRSSGKKRKPGFADKHAMKLLRPRRLVQIVWSIHTDRHGKVDI
jgi:hypothetical protein